jgi:hypothetical protein
MTERTCFASHTRCMSAAKWCYPPLISRLGHPTKRIAHAGDISRGGAPLLLMVDSEVVGLSSIDIPLTVESIKHLHIATMGLFNWWLWNITLMVLISASGWCVALIDC